MLLSCRFSELGVYFQKHGVEKYDFMIKVSFVVSSCLLAVLLRSEQACPRRRHRRAPGALGTPQSWGTRSSSGGQRPMGIQWRRLGSRRAYWHFCQRCHGERWPLDRRCRNRWSRPGSAQPLRGGEVVARLPVGDFHLTTPIPEELREVLGPCASRGRGGRAPLIPASPLDKQGQQSAYFLSSIANFARQSPGNAGDAHRGAYLPRTAPCRTPARTGGRRSLRCGLSSRVAGSLAFCFPGLSTESGLGFYSGSVITTPRSLCFFDIPAISRPYPGRIYQYPGCCINQKPLLETFF